MSVDVTVPAWKTKLGNAPAKQVLVMLADAANSQGVCHPDTAYICDRTELDKRTVLRVFQVFSDIGLVTRTRGKGLLCNGRTCNQIFHINLGMLGGDLVETFRKTMLLVQGKLQVITRVSVASVSETHVSETSKCVSETPTSVSETLPPYPLLGRTIKEPSGTTMRAQGAPGFAQAMDAASALVASTVCPSKLMAIRLQPVVREVMERWCEATGKTPAEAQVRMVASHREAYAPGAPGPRFALARWFGEGHWQQARGVPVQPGLYQAEMVTDADRAGVERDAEHLAYLEWVDAERERVLREQAAGEDLDAMVDAKAQDLKRTEPRLRAMPQEALHGCAWKALLREFGATLSLPSFEAWRSARLAMPR